MLFRHVRPALLFACLSITPLTWATDGAWSQSAAGTYDWNTAGNWVGATVASGTDATALFTNDFAGDIVVTGSYTLGFLSFVDPLTPGRLSLSDGTITLDVSSGKPTFRGSNAEGPCIRLGGTGATVIQGSEGLMMINSNEFRNSAFGSGLDWSGFSGTLWLHSGRYITESTNALPAASEILLGTNVDLRALSGSTRNHALRGLSGGDADSNVGNADGTSGGTLTLGVNSSAGDSYTFSGVLGGDGFTAGAGNENNGFGLAKTGAALQVLSSSNLYTDGTVLYQGTLAAGDNGALGPGRISLEGGTLMATNGGRILPNAVRLFASSTIGGTTPLEFSGAMTNHGGSRTLTVANTATTTLSGPVYLSNVSGVDRAVTFNVASVLHVSGNIADAGVAGVSTGRITKTGAGTLILSGTNTYRGQTKVDAGVIVAASDDAFGVGYLSINDGSILEASGGARTISVPVDINTDTTFRASANLTFAGSFTNRGGSRVLTITNSARTTFSGPVFISNSNSVERRLTFHVPVSTVVVSGAIANFNGANTVTGHISKTGAGRLTLSGANINTGNTRLEEGTLALGADNSLSDDSELQVWGGTFEMNAYSDTAGGLSLRNDGVIGGSGTLTSTNQMELQFGVVRANLSGSQGFLKSSTNRVTFNSSSISSIGGSSVIVGGRLEVNGTLGDTDIDIQGGFLGGNNGTCDGVITLNGGRIAPTTTQLNLGELVLNSGSLRFDITNALGSPGSGWEHLVIDGGSGDVINNATNPVEIRVACSTATLPGFYGTNSHQWKVIDAGNHSGFSTNKFSINIDEFVLPFRWFGLLSVSENSGDLYVNYTAVTNVVDISVSIAASTNFAYAEEIITYTISVTNNGSSLSGAFYMTNVLPANMIYVGSGPELSTTSTAYMVWLQGLLQPGASTQYTVAGRVQYTGSTQPVNQVVNVYVAPYNGDPSSGNNSANTSVTLVGIPLWSNAGRIALVLLIIYMFHRRFARTSAVSV